MKLTISGSILILLAISAVATVLVYSSLLSGSIYEYQLAALSQIEAGMTKKWQESGGIQRELKRGNSGQDVILLQYALSRDDAADFTSVPTGFFGNSTAEALKRFQMHYGISASGILDEQTRALINNRYFSVLCPAPAGLTPYFTVAYIDREHGLPSAYVPPDLRDASRRVKTVGSTCLRADALEALEKMFADAKKENIFLGITSGYRRPEIQKILYDFWISVYGYDATRSIAFPGHSEHQLGTAVDLTGASIGYAGVSPQFADSPEGRWVAQNAHTYGFVLSYPNGKEGITGYSYEPWHYRYVGPAIAGDMKKENSTLNEMIRRGRYPIPKLSAKNISVTARAAYGVLISPEGNRELVFQKNKDMPFPIASVTKLFTALAAKKRFSDSEIIPIPADVLGGKGDSGRFAGGEKYTAKDLLRSLLVESNNDAAEAFAAAAGAHGEFVDEMNRITSSLGLKNTKFANPSGIDGENMNYSSAEDVARVMEEIIMRDSVIARTLSLSESEICTADNSRCYTATTTNALLLDPLFPMKIKGGKTGDTPRAEKNLALALDAPSAGWRVTAVILGSDDHFRDMRALIGWMRDSFEWP